MKDFEDSSKFAETFPEEPQEGKDGRQRRFDLEAAS